MTFRRTVSILALLLVTCSSLAVAEEAAEGIESAHRAYAEERFQEAAEGYRKALAKQPSPAIYLNLGHCLLRLNRFAEATEAYRSAAKLDPAIRDIEWLLGHASYGAGQHAEAIRHFDRASTSKPEALFWMGQAHEQLGDSAAAESCYRQAGARDPELRNVREALAALCLRLRRCEEAAEIYGTLTRRFPAVKAFQDGLARAKAAPWVEQAAQAYADERFRRAAELYRQAVEALPSADLLVNLGHACLHAQDYEAAEQAYRRALDLDPGRRNILEHIGRALVSAGKYRDAVGPLTEARKASPREDLSLLLAHTHEQLGETAQAETIYQDAAGANLERRRPAEALAALYLRENRLADTIRVLGTLAEREPEDRRLRKQLSELRAAEQAKKGSDAFSSGRYDAALRHFQAAVQETPTAELLVNLGHASLAAQRYQDATQAYRKAMELQPGRQDIHWPLSQALYQSGELLDAVEPLRRSIQEIPRESAYILMGKCYELTGCAVSARLAYEEGAVRFAESRVLREALAGLYVSQGMPLLAVRIYEGLIRRFPGDASLLRNLAQAHLACHEPDRAIPWLEMAHRLSPEDTSICQMLADLYLARRMNREASEAYRLLLALTEKPTAEDHFRLAHAYFQSDELVSAKEALDRAIALDPSHAPSCLYLGHVARRQGRTADAALLYEKAIALSPGLRAAHLALANLFLQQKDYGRAAHYYREGLQEDGADPTTLRNAIIALFRSGDPSGSASLLRDASRKYPGHPDLRDLWLLFPARPRTPGTPVDPTASGSSEEDRPRPAGGIPRPP